MKSILEVINESLIKEGKFKNIVVAFDHDLPETNYLFTDMDSAGIKDLKKLGFYVQEVKNPTNLIRIEHSDEPSWGEDWVKSIGNTESEMKSRAMKDIKDALKRAEDNGLEDGDELLINTPMVELDFIYSPSLTADKIYKELIKYINESYIEEDSGSAISIFDLTKMEVLYGNNMRTELCDLDTLKSEYKD